MMTPDLLSSSTVGLQRTPGVARLLVATDFSPRSICALERAQLLPLRPGAELLLVHVLPQDTRPGVPPEEEEALAQHCLQGAVSHARERLAPVECQVRGLLVNGPIEEALAGAARNFRAELVVLGRPRGSRSRWDRTRERVTGGWVHRAPTPLLLVGGPPVGPYRRPLVAMDFSEAARLSLESVLRLCPQAERVAVLHDYDTSYDLVLHQAASLARFLEYRREAGEKARAALHQYLTPYREAGVRLEALIRSGEPAESILEVARQEHADLIAVGRHSRTALGRLVRPHVAELIASNAPGDVLVQLA